MAAQLEIKQNDGNLSTVLEGSTVTVQLVVNPTVPYTLLAGAGYATASPAGTATAGITLPNNGASFGPDTLLGSTIAAQTGPPYTVTTGIQEAELSAVEVGPVT